jgi:hypothetical protein
MDDAGGLGLMALAFGMVQAVLLGMFKFLERTIDKRAGVKHGNADGYLGCKVGSGDIGKLGDLMRQNIELQKNMIDEHARLRTDNSHEHRRIQEDSADNCRRILRHIDGEKTNP